MIKRVVSIGLALQVYAFGIVSVAPVEPGEKRGLSGEVDFAFKESSGNTARKDYSSGAKVQYDYTDRTDFILGNYLYAESEGEKVEDKNFVHYRHLDRFTGKLVLEAYAQGERNAFINLTRRELVGAGARYRFFGTETIRLYVGAGAYGSVEAYDPGSGDVIDEYKNRSNIYLSYTQKESENFEATATLYYQPAWDDGNDYYLLANGDLKFYLTQKLQLKLSVGAKEDSEPFEGNKKSDSYYILGFGYSF